MRIQWNSVTWYSKLLAIFLFILVIPVWTFYLGMRYEQAHNALVAPTTAQL